MSQCNCCAVETVYENRKSIAKKESDCQKQLEAALKKVAELEAQIAETKKNPCCPLFKIESITAVGQEVLVTFDNCTYLKAPVSVVDNSFSQDIAEAEKATVAELQKALTELTTKVNSLGNTSTEDTGNGTVSSETVLEILKTAEGKAAMLEVLKGTEVQNINEETQGYLLAK